MTARPATAEEIGTWDKLVSGNPYPDELMQSKPYGQLKSEFGWQARHYIFQDNVTKIAVLFLVRNLPYYGELWYAPRGPAVSSTAQLGKLLKAITPELAKAFLVKLEPPLLKSTTKARDFRAIGLVKAQVDLQMNQSTTIVNLSPTDDEILSSFKQKTRYNIRLSERKKVSIRRVELTRDNMKIMYGFLQETQKRSGFYLRSYKYMEAFWSLFTKAGRGELFMAFYDNQPLGGVFVTMLGKKSQYKDGGFTREHSGVMAPYLIQWEIIKWLKTQAVVEYDLYGMPPLDALTNKAHSLSGLVQFKSGFSIEFTEYVGVYDWPLSATKYRHWLKFGEKLLSKRELLLKNNLFY